MTEPDRRYYWTLAREVLATVHSALVIGCIAVLAFMALFYAGGRLRQIRQLKVDVQAVAEAEARLRSDLVAHAREMQAEIAELKVTVYGPLTEHMQQQSERRPSSVELWQLNRDEAIQNRLRVLEQHRLKVDRILDELRRDRP